MGWGGRVLSRDLQEQKHRNADSCLYIWELLSTLAQSGSYSLVPNRLAP